MGFTLDTIDDKIEFFEGVDLQQLEKKINDKIEQNRAILLQVHAIQHQSHIDVESGYRYFTAVVHFKAKK